MSEALNEEYSFQPEPGVELVAIAEQIRDWPSLAACKDVNPELFYTELKRGPKPDYDPNNLIGRFCMNCVVADDCLVSSIMNDDKLMVVAGGLTIKDRLPLLRSYKEQKAQNISVPVIEVRRQYDGLTDAIPEAKKTSRRKKPAVNMALVQEFLAGASGEELRAIQEGLIPTKPKQR